MKNRDLAAFRKILLGKRTDLVRGVQRAEKDGREMQAEQEAMDIADLAASGSSKEFLFSLSNADRQLLQTVDEALIRVEDGTFGLCLGCEDRIGDKRLRAVPWTPYCLHCQESREAS